MESTKKKTASKRSQSPVDVAEKEKVVEEEVQTVAPTKTKKGKATTTTKKSKSKEVVVSTPVSNTVSLSSADDMATESEIEPSQTTTTTTTTTTSNGTTTSTSIPTTPISKYIPSLSNMGTPLSPNRNALRLKEKDELNNIKSKLQLCLKKLESTENELEKKNKELDDMEHEHSLAIGNLKNRNEHVEKQLIEEIKTKSELMSSRDALESELKTKEASWKKDQDEYVTKLTETINKLNQEHSTIVSQLKTDIAAREYESDTLKTEVNRLKEDLQYRMRESEDKSRKLLENEYKRMKEKEEEFNQVLLIKDEEIKKLKVEVKEKDKLHSASSKKENELKHLIEAHERQIEDIRDSINREWEVRAVQMVEEHNARTFELQQSVESFEEEKQRYKGQISLYGAQIDELNIKNNEFEDKVKELNDLIAQKDSSIGVLNNELEESKKRYRKQAADLKNKDSQISLLQVEMNGRESKCATLQAEISRLKSEIFSITSQTEPDIPLTREIEEIKTLVGVFEKNVNERKRKRNKVDDNNAANVNQTTADPNISTDIPSSAAQVDPEELEKFNPNTVTFAVVDTNQEFIRLSVHGDYDNGLSLSKWRLIVAKPDGSKAGFSFPEGIQPFRGIKSVTVWTGRPRPGDSTTTENEFYWSRQGLWSQPVEGTIVKLVSPSEETTTVTIPETGIYEKVQEEKSKSCLIM
ncbi:hypothetical protein DICPUDRAFT_159593 [Dictyostelium purpureum]|uniref:LTD domain-containing protein n=1 Tax=Dictyostelium purpureum TaxID=5786 RepID=F1A4H6_DICPU|nr:uncharacterized protein DICPUDRAFT_159593 [Dictyostelium purpureum]EGC28907.1 hypothetical protein DICPUDRAFT_159593 [Dictyostelium purpureum]|eukprot:XP_003294572.1 hypothetical protein DICPUDRAFT_159593 [Dictyostelium purpureum]